MKFLFDLFPIILFFVTFKIYGIYAATAVAIAATFVQISWVWFRHRKVENMLWINLVTWVNFKLFGTTGLMLTFVIVQSLFIAKYMKEAEQCPISSSNDPSNNQEKP